MMETSAQIPQVTLMAAFGAGLLSFVSPCVLPLVPSYISYITGLTVDQLKVPTERQQFRKAIILNALLFIAGLSSIFIALGASASLIGQFLMPYQESIRKIGAVLIVLLGLHVLGVLKIGWLDTETRLHFPTRPLGYGGSFLIGVAFAAGWTPCIGPILASILLCASTSDRMLDAFTLLLFYSAGLGLPFLVAALGLDRFLDTFKLVGRSIQLISIGSGLLLIAIGVLLYSDSIILVTSYLERYGIGWYVGQ